MEQAHRYALFNSDCNEVENYINEHQLCINTQQRSSRWSQAQSHSDQFANWFRDKVINNDVPDHIFLLAKGPSPTSRRYTGYYINGYKFYTEGHDERCKTQNSGVSVTALTPSFSSSRDKNPVVGDVDYYGAILDIVELNYWSKFNVVLFLCEWYQVEKDEYGLSCLNANKLFSSNDPYVMSSQVHQVFYVPDPLVKGLQYVMTRVPGDLHEGDYCMTDENSYWSEPIDKVVHSLAGDGDEEIQLSRDDMPPIIIGADTSLADLYGVDNEDDASD